MKKRMQCRHGHAMVVRHFERIFRADCGECGLTRLGPMRDAPLLQDEEDPPAPRGGPRRHRPGHPWRLPEVG